MSRFALDPSCRLLEGGRVVLGGSPLTMFRISAAGARVIERLRAGADLDPTTTAALTDRLVETGAAHPLPDAGGGPGADEVTLVIPAHRASAARLGELVRQSALANVIIVDDASPEPLGPVPGATVVRLDRNVGPGGARSAGLALVTTPFVAMLDTDTYPDAAWLTPLLGHLADERVALVAPRVRSVAGRGVLARYERWRSPLDMGASPGRVRAGTRVGYVPAAALVGRVAAITAVGGFDAELRFGEDVDLVWRLDAAGWRVRYEPASVVEHAPRPDLSSWLRQRVNYGSSAAPLARRHPGAVAPVRLNVWSVVAWTAGVVTPVAGVAIAGWSTAALARKLSTLSHPWRLAARLAGLGNLHAGRVLASALTRAWFPATVVVAICSRRCRRILAVALVVPPVVDWLHDRPDVDVARAVALRIIDDVAYGAGLWAGALHERSFAALRPELSRM